MSDERETIQRNPESVAAWKRECAFLREQVEKLTAALKLAREALKFDGYPCGTGCKCIACEALAAIDSLQKGE